MLERKRVLENAPGILNKPNQPWEVTIEGNSLVARWKWMDATFFGPADINKETKEFTFTVTLDDKGNWKEVDEIKKKAKNLNMANGLGVGVSSSFFKGKTMQKSFELGLGKDNKTGKVGLIKSKFDTSMVKRPIRDYLTSCGWKKSSFWSSNQKPSQDSYQESNSDFYQEVPDGSYQDHSRDSYQEPSRDSYQDYPRGSYQEPSMDSYQDVPGSSYQGSSKDSYQKRPVQNSNKTSPIILIVAAIAVCCVGAIVVFLLFGTITLNGEQYSVLRSTELIANFL